MGNAASYQNRKRAAKTGVVVVPPESSLSSVGQRNSSKGRRRLSMSRKTTGGSAGTAAAGKQQQLSKKNMTNAQLVEEYWCNALNRHEMKRILKFCAPGCQCWFEGADSGMNMEDFLGALLLLVESFPDNHMRWDAVEEIAPGIVRIQNFVGHATHTGKPFSFGPYPPIAATGIVVEEDPCHLTITVKNGKMVKFVIDAYLGNLVGPPGYYEKIGGKLVP